ncbi:MAG: hypothetical protein KAF27_10700 [Porphyrobacter sp.]|nr:hypothetical protein [Porphyrobacter sp.]
MRDAAAGLVLAWAFPLAAQDQQDLPPMEAPPAETPQPAGEVYEPFDAVEVYDPVNDTWDPCTVLTVFKGAYSVSCNHEKTIQRDIHVRREGGQPVGQTAAQAVTGPPFKRGDIVLASIMGLPNDWRLCVVMRNDVAKSNGYGVDCGNEYRVLPDWVRKDPKAPQ